jgi:hypothetical protein
LEKSLEASYILYEQWTEINEQETKNKFVAVTDLLASKI